MRKVVVTVVDGLHDYNLEPSPRVDTRATTKKWWRGREKGCRGGSPRAKPIVKQYIICVRSLTLPQAKEAKALETREQKNSTKHKLCVDNARNTSPLEVQLTQLSKTIL